MKVWILRQVDPSPPCNGGGPVGWWVEPTIFTGLDHNEGELAGHQGEGTHMASSICDEGPHYLEEATMGLGYGQRPTCPYWSLFSVQFRGPLQWMDPLSVGGRRVTKAHINERKIGIGSWLRCRENRVVYHHSGQGTTDYSWIIRILQSTTIDYDNDFREELELGCIAGKSNMDVEAQVMSRNSMASGLPVKKFLISGPSSPMKKQDLGNILITNPVSNHRAYEEFQIRNHMLAAVSESDGFSNLL
ncbi:hypothetical protein NC653_032730 [Populus alba x Populus x berolinensis]|uniref:Uncharacterized protein n=1 Tax=Populus alba x Populus x berolinensis TaxID=444605 RepID=A0AAD6PZE3_9ROSI|nr:hypothetical protein NC653_032730 [Populus alba x Populus x berolinensis]